MSNFVSLLTLALAATSASAAVFPRVLSPVHHARKLTPSTYDAQWLESYQVYHTRYLALSCQDKHGQPFFDMCCHPLLKTETLEKNRDASCVPHASASSSAALAENTSTVVTPDDDDLPFCDEEDDASSSAAPAPSAAPSAPAAPISSAAAPVTSSAAAQVTSSKAAQVTSSKATAAAINAAADPTAASSTKAEPTSSKAEPTSSKAEPTSSKAEPTSSKAEPASTKAEPTSTKAAEPSTTQAAAPTSAPLGGIFSGDATFFLQNGVAGACGDVHSDWDLVVAMDTRRYGVTGRSSDLCGKSVKITNTKNQKSVVAMIADACPTCNTKDSIDLSKGAFLKIATEDEGLVPMTWSFV